MKRIGVISIAIILIAIPATLFLAQNRTQLRQQAAEKDDEIEKFFDENPQFKKNGIYERYKVCTHNDEPKKCFQKLLPPPSITSSPSPSPYLTIIPTSLDNSSIFFVTVCPHGIGSCGDNANSSSQGNLNPIHQERTIILSFYDLQNNFVNSIQGTVNYASAAGNFSGIVETGKIPDGIYNVKIHEDGFLTAGVPVSQTLKPNNTYKLPVIPLIVGDINNDNIINVEDYNLLMTCYSDLTQPASCAPDQKQAADLNDDGGVDFLDYNLYMRELSVQRGA